MQVKLTPTPHEIEALRKTAPPGPVTIVNLLKFKPGRAGRAAYRRYLNACPAVSETKVEVIYSGNAIADVGGGADWDYVIIARHAAFDDFADTVTESGYQVDAAAHRPDALEKTVMLVCAASPLNEI